MAFDRSMRVMTLRRLVMALALPAAVGACAAGTNGSGQGASGGRANGAGGVGAGGAGGQPAADPLFVAVGATGTIVTSPDGLEWTARPFSPALGLSSVAAGPAGFVAVGEAGVIVASRDGRAWQRAESSTTSHLRHVIYASDRFVTVGETFTAGAVTLTSMDGLTWTAIASPEDHMFHGVAYTGGNLIAAAYYRSDLQTPAQFHAPLDGVWSKRPGPDFYASLEAAGMLLVTGGRPAVSVSTDSGTSWEVHALDTTGMVVDVAFDGTTFVAVGDLGRIFTSPDGRAWSKQQNPLALEGSSSGIAHGRNTFVAVGPAERVLTSPDGVTWTAQASGTPERLVDVAYGPTR